MLFNHPKMILCTANDSLTAGIWHGNKLNTLQTFTNNEAGHEAFADYLLKNKQTNIYLIANSIDEDYRVESLPHTTGKTRSEILTRKLNQFSRNAVYRTAHFIDRDADKRKDDRFLFVALNSAELLSGWIAQIKAQEAPLVGVYMLPMISQEIIRLNQSLANTAEKNTRKQTANQSAAALQSPHVLLCEQLNSGLRQSYLKNGKLRMSRMVSFKARTEAVGLSNSESEDNKYSAFYAEEIEKTRLYLMSQRLISRETPLHIVLTTLEDNSRFSEHIAQQMHTICTQINLSRLANPYLITPELLKLNPELLHMQILANGFVPISLAPPGMTKTYQLNNVRSGIIMASILVAVIGSFSVLGLFYKSMSLSNETQIKINQTVLQQRLYRDVAKDFPNSPVVSSELKTAVELAQQIKANSKTPARLMQVLSGALDAQPEIQLARLRWMLSNDSAVKDDDTTGKNSANGTQTPNVNVTDPLNLLEIGFINAEIKDFSGDYRAALNSVTRFVAMLKANSAVMLVTVEQEPVNVSSFANLQGSTADENATERPPAVFKLKLVLKPAIPKTNANQVNVNQAAASKAWAAL